MAPLIALVSSFILFRGLGYLGWTYFDEWHSALQFALAIMLLLTASAHWGKRRPDLIRMVPPSFQKPALIATITGYFELAAAVGILLPATSLAASICLTLLMIAMFPANIHAARERLTIGGKSVPRLEVRALLQVVFIAVTVLVGVG